MSVPEHNLASRIIERAGAGYVCDPNNATEFLERAEFVWANRELATQMGLNARRYAESNFDIDRIGNLFEEVLRVGELDALAVASHMTMRASP